jgi:hypothetical protein
MLLHNTSFTCILFMYHNQRTAAHKTYQYILECNFSYYSCRIWRNVQLCDRLFQLSHVMLHSLLQTHL